MNSLTVTCICFVFGKLACQTHGQLVGHVFVFALRVLQLQLCGPLSKQHPLRRPAHPHDSRFRCCSCCLFRPEAGHQACAFANEEVWQWRDPWVSVSALHAKFKSSSRRCPSIPCCWDGAMWNCFRLIAWSWQTSLEFPRRRRWRYSAEFVRSVQATEPLWNFWPQSAAGGWSTTSWFSRAKISWRTSVHSMIRHLQATRFQSN